MDKKAYGIVIWFIATMFVVYAFCLNTAAAVFAEAIKSTLNTTNTGVALISAAFVLGFACMQIPAGYLLDKYCAKIIVSSGILILALGNLAITYANNVFLAALANLFQGVGASFAFIAVAVLISQWFSAKLFPILFGLTQAISCIFAGIIHYLFTLALTDYKWQTLYQLLAVFGTLLCILAFIFITVPDNKHNEQPLSLFRALTLIIRNKQIWLCSLAAAMSFGVLLAYASYWYLPIQIFYSVDNLQAVIISGLIFVGIGVGTPLLAWLSNHFKTRVGVIYITLVLGTMALLLGVYLPHFNIDTLIIIKLVSFFIGFFLAGSMLFYTIISEIASEKTRGMAVGLLNMIVFLFNTILLFLPASFMTTHSPQFFTYLWTLPFFILCSLLLLYFIHDTQPGLQGD